MGKKMVRWVGHLVPQGVHVIDVEDSGEDHPNKEALRKEGNHAPD